MEKKEIGNDFRGIAYSWSDKWQSIIIKPIYSVLYTSIQDVKNQK